MPRRKRRIDISLNRKIEINPSNQVLEESFSFFSFRFSFIVSFAFFLASRLPLSLFPLSPIWPTFTEKYLV